MGWTGWEYLNINWRWVRKSVHGRVVFKISRRLNMSRSVWERLKMSASGLKMSGSGLEWMGMCVSGWEWFRIGGSGWE